MKNRNQTRSVGILPMGDMKRIGKMPMPRLIVIVLALLAPLANAQGFTNSLGMKFVPVPIYNGSKVVGQVMFCTTDVTVDQYKAAGMGYQAPDFPQKGNHPAVNVSWNDAKAYCAWLSKKEGKKYRLPTDHEWSCAVGIGRMENPKASQDSKQWTSLDDYPWGKGKPTARSGNYRGLEWDNATGVAYMKKCGVQAGSTSLIPVNDGYMFTSPVGSFAPNSLGLYDMGGNVRQWCESSWNFGLFNRYRVVRGGSWFDEDTRYLLSSVRDFAEPSNRSDLIGFRCIVVSESSR